MPLYVHHLKIEFHSSIPEVAKLDGQVLCSAPEFLLVVHGLAHLFQRLKRDMPEDRSTYGIYRDSVSYSERHAEADDRFSSFLSYLGNVEAAGADFPFSLEVSDYDPEARRFAAACMLLSEPISGKDAEDLHTIFHWLGIHMRAEINILPMFDPQVKTENLERAASIFTKFEQCLQLASEKNVSFSIDL